MRGRAGVASWPTATAACPPPHPHAPTLATLAPAAPARGCRRLGLSPGAAYASSTASCASRFSPPDETAAPLWHAADPPPPSREPAWPTPTCCSTAHATWPTPPGAAARASAVGGCARAGGGGGAGERSAEARAEAMLLFSAVSCRTCASRTESSSCRGATPSEGQCLQGEGQRQRRVCASQAPPGVVRWGGVR